LVSVEFKNGFFLELLISEAKSFGSVDYALVDKIIVLSEFGLIGEGRGLFGLHFGQI
jgi:hypothetical protein